MKLSAWGNGYCVCVLACFNGTLERAEICFQGHLC